MVGGRVLILPVGAISVRDAGRFLMNTEIIATHHPLSCRLLTSLQQARYDYKNIF